jgi:hypothetical protein
MLGIFELAAGPAVRPRTRGRRRLGRPPGRCTLQAVNLLASLRNGTRPLALPARLLALAVAVAVAQAFLPGGLLLALIATLRLDASAPFAGRTREPRSPHCCSSAERRPRYVALVAGGQVMWFLRLPSEGS